MFRSCPTSTLARPSELCRRPRRQGLRPQRTRHLSDGDRQDRRDDCAPGRPRSLQPEGRERRTDRTRLRSLYALRRRERRGLVIPITPMPPPPYVPAKKPSPPITLDPATAPLLGATARERLTTHYLTTNTAVRSCWDTIGRLVDTERKRYRRDPPQPTDLRAPDRAASRRLCAEQRSAGSHASDDARHRHLHPPGHERPG